MDNGNYLWFSQEMKLFMRVIKCTWFSETIHGFQNHEQKTKKEKFVFEMQND